MIKLDPVCRMEVNAEDTKYITEYQGQTYYFDTEECLHEFETAPETFVGAVMEKVYNEHGDRMDGSE